jgi:hypothetical protein
VVAAVKAPPVEGKFMAADVASAAGRVLAPPAPPSVTEGEDGCGLSSGGGVVEAPEQCWRSTPLGARVRCSGGGGGGGGGGGALVNAPPAAPPAPPSVTEGESGCSLGKPRRRTVAKTFLFDERSLSSSKSLCAANSAHSATVHSRRGNRERAIDIEPSQSFVVEIIASELEVF